MPAPPLDGILLITGASSGIGAEFARILAGSARALVLVARRRERLDALAAELTAARPGLAVHVRAVDLSDVASIFPLLDEIEATIGPIDVVVNNAGFGDMDLIERAAWPKLQQMIAVNVAALTALTWRLVPGMVKRGRGGILLMSSGYGLTWTPAAATYVGTKYFVSGFSESLRAELGGTGVVVTQVCPGPVATEFEAVAGFPAGLVVPGFLQISARTCAEQAVRGFARNRALVIPGWRSWLIVTAGRLTPDWLLRIAYLGVGRLLRRRIA